MQKFDKNPILNSPYRSPEKHWKLDKSGLPTGAIEPSRRRSTYLIPVPPVKRKKHTAQSELIAEESNETENTLVKPIRQEVEAWRRLPLPKSGVTYATQELLKHWRSEATLPRLFFCQLEAIETLIWLNEIAPNTREGRKWLEEIAKHNEAANPGLVRFATKMATGAGKTVVMAMLIAYHAINKARLPKSSVFVNHFLIITPGITIKDRLRVLLPQDPNNYYKQHNLVPDELRGYLPDARVVVANYHTFQRRETQKLTKQEREVLRGHGEELDTLETEGKMLRRACRELLRADQVIIINDEAHHCYRQKEITKEDSKKLEWKLDPDEKQDLKADQKAARLWITGIETLGKTVELRAVHDLSATPFFLRGSGHAEGRLFPWVVSDFSLMDAIECGIVKLPRLPVDDPAVTKDQIPVYRNLYQHIEKDLPKKGFQKEAGLDPRKLPPKLIAALTMLYREYAKTHKAWKRITIPPVFIVVCNNTATSKLVYEFISGWQLPNGRYKHGEFSLFNNIGEDDKPRSRLHTLLIDSRQLESGEALTPEFKKLAAAEIEAFKQELRERDGARDVGKITDAEILREVMNTVGKPGKLGEQVRCVVSVSMLSEGWDASNVTHILGVRRFGTQLLCEQVVGRGLRRMNYEPDPDTDLLPAEYAEIFGVPFHFARGGPPPPPPLESVHVRALPERAALTIYFPRVMGYHYQPQDERLTAEFSEDSQMVITPESAAPAMTEQSGIIGEKITMSLEDLKQRREKEVVFHLAAYTATHYYAKDDGSISPARFHDLLPIVRRWMDKCLTCTGGTFPKYLLWVLLAEEAAEKIYRACRPNNPGKDVLRANMSPYNPKGSSAAVNFTTRKKLLYETNAKKSHVNIAVCDSEWEMDFCKMLEGEAAVVSYVRNDRLGFTVPYVHAQENHDYYPDFIVQIERGDGDVLNLVVEIKGQPNAVSLAKADTMRRLWVPAVNNHGGFGEWAFTEITDMRSARRELARFIKGTPSTLRSESSVEVEAIVS